MHHSPNGYLFCTKLVTSLGCQSFLTTKHYYDSLSCMYPMVCKAISSGQVSNKMRI